MARARWQAARSAGHRQPGRRAQRHRGAWSRYAFLACAHATGGTTSWSGWAVVKTAVSCTGDDKMEFPWCASTGRPWRRVAPARVWHHEKMAARWRTWSLSTRCLAMVALVGAATSVSARPDRAASSDPRYRAGIFGAPSATWSDNTTFDILVRGPDGALFRKRYQQTWQPWQDLGSCARSGVSLSNRGNGVVDVAVVVAMTASGHGWYRGSGKISWQSVRNADSRRFSGTPAITYQAGAAGPTIVARDRSNHDVVMTSWSAAAGWSSFSALGVCSKRGVGAAARSLGHAKPGAQLDIVVTACTRPGQISLGPGSNVDPRADSAITLAR
jgi:hypothetical protein